MDTEERAVAVRARLHEMQLQEMVAGQAGPSCRTCIYGPITDTGIGKCDHIAHWQRRHDPVSGKWLAKLDVTTDEARSPSGLCGPEGLLYERYSLPRKMAKWLAKADAFILLWLMLALLFCAGAIAITILGRW